MRANLLVILLVATGIAGAAEPVAPGDPVPPGALTTLAGEATDVRVLRGEGPLVLMSWCSSCHSCRGAEGDFDRFAARYRGRAAVYALASNPRETVVAVRDRQATGGLSFPVVLDPAGAFADALAVTCTTTALVIARDGTLAYRGPFAGRGGDGGAEAALREVLAGHRPSVREREQVGCPVR
jgi:thiol-disulfide isomerase/thioredoxin